MSEPSFIPDLPPDRCIYCNHETDSPSSVCEVCALAVGPVPDEKPRGRGHALHLWQEAHGFVCCDDDCGAKDHPVTLVEYVEAYHHWRDHGRSNGCSHGS